MLAQKIDSILPKSIFLIQKSYQTAMNFDRFEFSRELKLQLQSFNLTIYNTDEIREGSLFFTTDYFGKSFFKDSYTIYKNDLNRFLPKPPSLTKHYFLHQH